MSFEEDVEQCLFSPTGVESSTLSTLHATQIASISCRGNPLLKPAAPRRTSHANSGLDSLVRVTLSLCSRLKLRDSSIVTVGGSPLAAALARTFGRFYFLVFIST